MTNRERKHQADCLLYEYGLWNEVSKLGTPHIIGSYRMDMMAWNDLDLDIENDSITMESMYELTTYIMRTFHPIWYEAKEEIQDGKRVWFHGFETIITGELWNVDLWFFDRERITAATAYCDDIAARCSQIQKDAIVEIKQALIARGLYSFEQYKSMDVYRAVLEYDVRNVEEFLTLLARKTKILEE